jgi:hypothetical protein
MEVKNRENSTVADLYGIDPLLDKSFMDIHNLPSVRTHLVAYEERARPELISYREYKTIKLWWVILLNNAIICPLDILEGMVLNIPNYSDVMVTLNRSVRYGSMKLDSSSVSI